MKYFLFIYTSLISLFGYSQYNAKWQLNNEHCFIPTEQGELIENKIDDIVFAEGNCQFQLGNDLYILTGPQFYKNNTLIDNQLEGEITSYQASYILANIDSTQLVLFYGSFPSYYYSVYDIASNMIVIRDEVLVANNTSESMDIIRANSTDAYIFHLDRLGIIYKIAFNLRSYEFEAIKINNDLAGLHISEAGCNVRVSNSMKMLAVIEDRHNNTIFIFRHSPVDQKYYLFLEISNFEDFWGLDFSIDDRFLYFNESNKNEYSLNRVRLNSNEFEFEKIRNISQPISMNVIDSFIYLTVWDTAFGNDSLGLIILKHRELAQDIEIYNSIQFKDNVLFYPPNNAVELNDNLNVPQYPETHSSVFGLIMDSKYVWVPRAFTPNSDGINDQFNLYWNAGIKNKVSEFEICIYNRYGILAYRSTDCNFSIEGHELSKVSNSYYYEFTFLIENQKFVYSGSFVNQR